MPAVLMKMPSPLPRSTTLVSPVTMDAPASSAGRRHRVHDPLTRLDREALLENEARAQGHAARAPHIARSLTVP